MTVSAPRKDNFNLVAAGLALLHFLLGLIVFEPTLFPGGDNAAYLILGEALRTGEGYRDLYLPGTPLHDKYPPLLPSLLALSGWVGGVIVAKVLMLAFTSGVVWVTAHFGRRWAGKGPALAAAGVLAVNPTLLEYGHYILSEAPFTLFVTLALWLALRGDRKSVAFALVAASMAFMTRTAGLALLVALPLAWLLEGRRVRALGAAGAAVGVIGGWVLYQRWAAPGRGGYLAELLLANPYDAGAGSVEVGGLVVRAAENSWRYVESVLPQTLAGPGTLSGAGGVSVALGLAVAGAALAGWALRAREGLRPVEVFAFLYTGINALALQIGFLHPLDSSFGVGHVMTTKRSPSRNTTTSGHGKILLSISIALPDRAHASAVSDQTFLVRDDRDDSVDFFPYDNNANSLYFSF